LTHVEKKAFGAGNMLLKKELFLVFLEYVIIPATGLHHGIKMFSTKKYTDLVTVSDEAFAFLLLENCSEQFLFHLKRETPFKRELSAEEKKNMPRFKYSTQKSTIKKRIKIKKNETSQDTGRDDRGKKRNHEYEEIEEKITKKKWNENSVTRFLTLCKATKGWRTTCKEDLNEWSTDYYKTKASGFFEESIDVKDKCELKEEQKNEIKIFCSTMDMDTLDDMEFLGNMPNLKEIEKEEMET
jgi:hypothetical protein